MVLDALRRSTGTLEDATTEQLGAYLSALDTDQFRGVVSNVKGIFHEMLVSATENSDGDGITTTIAGLTNQPGWDLEFAFEDGTSRLVQLKAVNDASRIYEHLERYPGIDVMATDEVAALIPGVEASGFKNAELEEEVREALIATYGPEVGRDVLEAASTSLLLGAAFAARRAIQDGKVDKRELKAAMGDLGVGLGTALALDVVMAGG